MDGFAICVIALALGQGQPAAAEKAQQPEAAPTSEESPGTAATPTGAPRPPLTPTPATTPTPSSTSTSNPTPASTATPTGSPAATQAPVREPAAAPSARPPRRAAAQSSQPRPTSAAVAPEAAAPGKPPAASPPAPTPRAADVVAGSQRAEPEREQALRAARSFLEALAASDPDALAQAASERFSFDGEGQSGREAVRRRWRALLAGRPGPPPQVNGVEVLSAQDAIARWGKPPARIAALARPGVWVALGDVGGRPVVLFLAREGGRIAVLGIHD
jgi:hypothetical protein